MTEEPKPEPDGWTVKVCLLEAFMFLKSHHLYTNKKLLQSKYTFSLLLSLWFHSWWLRFGVSERENSIFSSRHFSAHRLLSCQNPSAPFSMSSLKKSLWIYGLIWYFHLYFLVPIGARKEGRQRIPTTSRQHLSLSVSPHIFGGQKAKSGRTSSLISLTETPDSTAVCFQSVLHLLDFVCSILFVIFCKLVLSDLLKRRRSPKPTVVPPQDSITLQHVDSNHSVHKKLSNRSITHIITDITEPHRGTRATRSSSDFCH